MGGSTDIETEDFETAAMADDGPQLAICLVSGGMDSCVTAAIAKEENDELAFLHVSYGQRTEKREREAFEALANYYDVRVRLVISLEHLARIGGSSLTDTSMPVTTADLSAPDRSYSLPPLPGIALPARLPWPPVTTVGKYSFHAGTMFFSAIQAKRPRISAWQTAWWNWAGHPGRRLSRGREERWKWC